MRFRHLGIASAWLLLVSWTLHGQGAPFYPLDLVKPGQRGYGQTVFQGAAPERFDVEILGVLKNAVGPRQNLILARVSGGRIEEVGIFGGMSGSPVYLEDRLVGAIAYAFTFAKEPIAGITPIQEIIDVFKERPQPAFRFGQNRPLATLYEAAASSSPLDLLTPLGRPDFTGNSLGDTGGDAIRLTPIATPVNLSGFSPASIRFFSPYLEALGMVPVRGGGMARPGDFEDAPLQAGSTVTVQLVRGDLDVAATGTVTHISGSQIYAFGHPFLGIGYTDLPLNKAAVLTVVPSLMNSQKIAAATEFLGTIRQDRSTGVMGILGEKPKMIPVRLRLATSRNELMEYSYEVVTDTLLTPFLLTFAVHNSIVASERAIGGQTLQVRCTISLRNQPQVHFENSVSDLANSSVFAALSAASPVNFLLTSGFEDLVMEKVEIDITAVEQTREAALDKVWQDKVEVRPGEEVVLTVFLRKGNGEMMVERYPVKIPENLPPGPLQIQVGDGLSLIRSDAQADPGEFIPATLPQLIKAINNLKRNDRLYIRLYRDDAGVVVAGEGLPALPPSLRAIYNSKKTSGDARSIGRVVLIEHELPATDYVLKGQKTITLDVKG